MDFNEWWAMKQQHIRNHYGNETAAVVHKYCMDAFIHGKQYAFEEEVTNPLARYNEVFRSRTIETLRSTPQLNIEIIPTERFYDLGDINPTGYATSQEHTYLGTKDPDYPKWLKIKWDEHLGRNKVPTLCKSCGVVMRDSEGKPTLVCSDNLDYCVNCEK